MGYDNDANHWFQKATEYRAKYFDQVVRYNKLSNEAAHLLGLAIFLGLVIVGLLTTIITIIYG